MAPEIVLMHGRKESKSIKPQKTEEREREKKKSVSVLQKNSRWSKKYNRKNTEDQFIKSAKSHVVGVKESPSEDPNRN